MIAWRQVTAYLGHNGARQRLQAHMWHLIKTSETSYTDKIQSVQTPNDLHLNADPLYTFQIHSQLHSNNTMSVPNQPQDNHQIPQQTRPKSLTYIFLVALKIYTLPLLQHLLGK